MLIIMILVISDDNDGDDDDNYVDGDNQLQTHRFHKAIYLGEIFERVHVICVICGA